MPSRAERQIEAARRRAQAVQMRTAGLTFEQVGRELGITAQRAHQLYADALKRTVTVPTDEHIALEVDRLDHLQAQATAVLRRQHYYVQGGEVVVHDGAPLRDDGPTLAAIRTLLAVAERRARLLGLDQPTRVDAKVSLAVAWQNASEEEKTAVLDADLAALQAELDRRGPATPPAAEMLPSTTQATDTPNGEEDDQVLAEALAAGLAAAGVDLDDASLERVADAIESYLAHRRADPSSNGGRP